MLFFYILFLAEKRICPFHFRLYNEVRMRICTQSGYFIPSSTRTHTPIVHFGRNRASSYIYIYIYIYEMRLKILGTDAVFATT